MFVSAGIVRNFSKQLFRTEPLDVLLHFYINVMIYFTIVNAKK